MVRKHVISLVIVSSCLAFFTPHDISACEDDEVVEAAAQTASVQDEIEVIRQRVLQRCGLSPKLAQNKLPWYFFYEFGVELLDAGQADAALESLQMTASLKAEPARPALMYGMWYVNYLPYYQMSIAYSKLELWDRAWDAITMSEALVEFSPGDYEYEDFADLKEKIAGERKKAG